jgi:hypothetical protein
MYAVGGVVQGPRGLSSSVSGVLPFGMDERHAAMVVMPPREEMRPVGKGMSRLAA